MKEPISNYILKHSSSQQSVAETHNVFQISSVESRLRSLEHQFDRTVRGIVFLHSQSASKAY